MTAPKVRADYDQLKSAAGRFAAQAQAAQQFLGAIQGALAPLQDGDWVGLGASAFYDEMGGQVLPTLKRLAAALESGEADDVCKSARCCLQAEAEAARVLRGEGGADRTGLFAGAVTAPAPAGGRRRRRGGGAAGAGGAGAAARPRSTERAIGRCRGPDAGPGPGRGGSGCWGANSPPDVIALIQKSPTRQRPDRRAGEDERSDRGGPLARRHRQRHRHHRRTIAIGPRSTDAGARPSIAHEVGHATSAWKPCRPIWPWDARELRGERASALSARRRPGAVQRGPGPGGGARCQRPRYRHARAPRTEAFIKGLRRIRRRQGQPRPDDRPDGDADGQRARQPPPIPVVPRLLSRTVPDDLGSRLTTIRRRSPRRP